MFFHHQSSFLRSACGVSPQVTVAVLSRFNEKVELAEYKDESDSLPEDKTLADKKLTFARYYALKETI